MNDRFSRLAALASKATGSAAAFVVAAATIVVWAVTGPLFRFSDTWQLVINTGTTIVTFLMVFLIQNAQNRDSKALHLKVDELIRAQQGARNAMIDLERLDDRQLAELQQEFDRLCKAENPGEEEACEEAAEAIGEAARRQ